MATLAIDVEVSEMPDVFVKITRLHPGAFELRIIGVFIHSYIHSYALRLMQDARLFIVIYGARCTQVRYNACHTNVNVLCC